MVPDRCFVFLHRRTETQGRSMRCAEAVARAGAARLVVEDGRTPLGDLLPHSLTSPIRHRALPRRRDWDLGAFRRPCLDASREPDLVMKVPEPPSPVPPRRLHPMDRALLRHAPRPLWLLHPAQGPDLRVILAVVGLDGRLGPVDQTVLRSAASLARSLRGPLHVVFPWSLIGVSILASPTRGLTPGRTQGLLAAVQSGHEERLGQFVSATIPGAAPLLRVRRGDALTAVQEAAWEVEADVVVSAGNGPPTPGAFLLGGFLERLALGTPASLLVVNSGGWDGWAESGPAAIRQRRAQPIPAGVDA